MAHRLSKAFPIVVVAAAGALAVGLLVPRAGASSPTVTATEVSVGSPDAVTPQNFQSEPAVAIDAHNPDFLVAGANDNIDLQPCPRTLVTTEARCAIDNGVGVSGVYFSFDRGRTWTQPTYTGATNRGCGNETPCDPHLGPIGRVPWYYESGLVDAGDPAVAVGPRPIDGRFSWANGSRVYYGNITVNYPSGTAFAAIGVSRLDNPTPERVAQKSSWQYPVLVGKLNQTVFNDKPQIWADNAASSPYFGHVYSCYNGFRSDGQHLGTNSPPPPMYAATSTDGGSTWTNRQVTSADHTGSGPNDWGVVGCNIRTDSHGTVYLFAEMAGGFAIVGAPPPQGKKITPPPPHSAHVLIQSFDGGATWTRPRTLFRITDPCYFQDPLSFRCETDGNIGARTDIAGMPSVDIANGAPTGADATNLIIDAWSDASMGLNHEQSRVTWSADGGGTWHAPVVVSDPADRPIYTAPAISPNGDRAYVVYEAVTSPWRGADLSSPRPYHGVFVSAPVTAAGPAEWTTEYTGPFGDLRATFPGHVVWQERIGDYVYAAASRDYGVGLWVDTRDAEVCPTLQDWRAQSLAAGKPVLPAPWPLADCPAKFGNADVFAATTG
jgi:hypothetical protein